MENQIFSDLIQLLSDDSPIIRAGAVESLGRLESLNSLPHIVKMLADEDSSVSYIARHYMDIILSREQ